MACTITKGRLVDCKDQLGGLKKVFFLNDYASDFISAATLDGTNANEIDTIGATRGFLQYDLRQDLSSFTVNVQGDPLTGTFLYEQTLSVVLQKITVVDAAQIECCLRTAHRLRSWTTMTTSSSSEPKRDAT